MHRKTFTLGARPSGHQGLCSHWTECLEPVSDEGMQRQEVGGSKFNTTASARESEQPPEATQHEEGASFQDAGEEESAW